MSSIRCMYCEASGKRFDPESLSIGLITLRTCQKCKGTTKLSADDSLLSLEPDHSLLRAKELLRRRGKPIEICIDEEYSLLLVYANGERYYLGGLIERWAPQDATSARHQQGFNAFLEAAGYRFTYEQLNQVKPPVTIFIGRNFIFPQTKQVEGATEREAFSAAARALPIEAIALNLKVISWGDKSVYAAGNTDEEALASARSKLPTGVRVEYETVNDSCWFSTIITADSKELAMASLIDSEPIRPIRIKMTIVGSGEQGKASIEAFSEDQATNMSKTQIPSEAKLIGLNCIKPVSAIFLGLGKRPAIYEILWRRPVRVSVEWQHRVAEIRFNMNLVRAEITFQPSSDLPELASGHPARNDPEFVEGNLMWQRKCDGVRRSQAAAVEYCAKLVLGEFHDWRLPTLEDFRALSKNPEPLYTDYWTSTAEPGLSSDVAYIDDATTMFKTYVYYVRAVRDL